MKMTDVIRAALVALAGSLPLAAFAFAVASLLDQQHRAEIHKQLQRLAENFATAVEQKIRAEIGALGGLAASSSLDQADFSRFREEMQRLSDQHPDWFTVILSDGERQLVNLRIPAGEVLPPPRDPSTLARIRSTGQPAVGTFQFGRVGFGTAVHRNGSVRYTLAAVADPDLFVASLRRFQLPSGWIATVADASGRIIGRSEDPTRYAGQQLSTELRSPSAIESGRLFEAAGPSGMPVIGITRPVADFGWQVLVTVPEAAFSDLHWKLRATVWAGAGAAILLTIALSIVAMNAWASRREASALKDVNQRLRESEARFACLAGATAEGVAIHDNDRIVEANASFAQIFGYQVSEVIGRSLLSFIASGSRSAFLEHVRRGDEQPYESSGVRKDGSLFPLEVVGKNVDYAGRPMRVKLVRDLSRQKAAEAALQQSRVQLELLQTELAHVSRVTEMGQMTAALAHEVNQPLAAVTNYIAACQGLLEDSDANRKSTEKVRGFLVRINEQADRAAQIVRRLRNFMTRREVERAVEPATTLIDEALQLALPGAKRSGLIVRRHIASAGAVLVDRVQIQQVLVNLVRNAIEAMQDSSRKELDITTGDEDGMVSVQVADTGPGISPEVAGRLFEPFNSTKRQGMGIGLSVCRKIIEAHGGRIEAKQRPDGGTIFRFTLPKAAAG